MKETELHPPIEAWLQDQGYRVDAEVNGCDVVATRHEELLIVELKTALNLKLLVQASDRQRLTTLVYVAVPEPPRKDRTFRASVRLFKRLGIGLLLVRFSKLDTAVHPLHGPGDSSVRINRRARHALLKEIRGRSANYNVAGATRVPVMTAYKENAIVVARLLQHLGPSSPKSLVRLGTDPKTRNTLADNHYGWFRRIERGIYGLSEAGEHAAAGYPEIARLADQLLNSRDAP